MTHNQLTENGHLRHFLTIEGLKRPLLTEIMDRAEQFSSISHQCSMGPYHLTTD